MSSKYIKFIIFLIILSVFVILGAYFITWGKLPSQQAEWGTFGDFFGGISNPVFSLVNVLLLIVNMKVISDQFEEQKVNSARDSFASSVSQFIVWGQECRNILEESNLITQLDDRKNSDLKNFHENYFFSQRFPSINEVIPGKFTIIKEYFNYLYRHDKDLARAYINSFPPIVFLALIIFFHTEKKFMASLCETRTYAVLVNTDPKTALGEDMHKNFGKLVKFEGI